VSTAEGRRLPWIGVRFECCGVYARFYRNPHEDRYRVVCPRCHRRTELMVGPGGTDSRLFIVR